MFHLPMTKLKRLTDAYHFKGFTPSAVVKGVFGDSKSMVVRLKRRGKKQSARLAAWSTRASTTAKPAGSVTFPAVTGESSWIWRSGVSTAAGAAW